MPTKPGFQTTEFWLTVGAILFSLIEDGLKLNLPKEPLYAIITYILTRGWIKSTANNIGIKQ
jgi:hypothetical protein